MKTSLMRGWTSTSEYEKGHLRFPPIKEAKGIYLYGYDGKRYIDAKSQMMNVSFGHGIQNFRDAIMKQWDQIAYIPTMDGHGNRSAEEFANKLLSILPKDYKQVYCSGSGTSCTEIAIQSAREYWFSQNKRNKHKIVSITGSYHGNSALMSEISEYSDSNSAYRLNDSETYLKLVQPYCYRCPLGLDASTCGEKCTDLLLTQIEQLNPDEISAIIFETVQGNGMIELPYRYVKTLNDMAVKYEILLIIDEVLTGFSRAGYDFSFQKYGILPDIICLSKTISNGELPLAATVFNQKISNVLNDREIQIGSTQDGNPICTALGSAVIEHFTSYKWSEQVKELGEYFLASLTDNLLEYPIIGDIRGTGLLICVELVEDKVSKEPIKDMSPIHNGFIENGIFTFIENNFVYFVPPYTIDTNVIDYIVNKFKSIIENYMKEYQ